MNKKFHREWNNQPLVDKEDADILLMSKKLALTHEMRIIAEIITGWTEKKVAFVSGGIVQIPEWVNAAKAEHVKKTYRKFEAVKLLIKKLDEDFYATDIAKKGMFYCPYVPLQS